jgi:CBS domain-containing protein
MRVEELMSEAECCHPGDSIRDAARLMKEDDVGFVPICGRDEKPIGALTDRDIAIRCVAEGRSFDEGCESIMTKDVIGCRIGEDVSEVQQQMRDHQTSRVMVCDDDGKLRGVVSLQDLAESESEHQAGQTLQGVKSDQPPSVH